MGCDPKTEEENKTPRLRLSHSTAVRVHAKLKFAPWNSLMPQELLDAALEAPAQAEYSPRRPQTLKLGVAWESPGMASLVQSCILRLLH